MGVVTKRVSSCTKLFCRSVQYHNIDKVSATLREYGLDNLIEKFDEHNISTENIWLISEDTLEEWGVELNDRLDYKRKKEEIEDLEAGKGKSKLVAFLLSFFLGEFGVDWFYLSNGSAGYIVAGIFKLITLGFLGYGG